MPAFANSLLIAATALLASIAPSAWAHQIAEPLEAAATKAAEGAHPEHLSGTVHRILIDDRVAGLTVEFLSLERDDGGGAIALRDIKSGSLQPMARIEITGRRNGKAFFVSALRQLAPATARAGQKAKPLAKIEGTLVLLHADHFDEARSEFMFEVHDASGEVTPLELNVIPEALQRGMQVIVEGRASADNVGIVPEKITILALPVERRSKTEEKAVRTNNVLLILMTFTDSPAVPFTPAQAQSVFAGGPGSGSVTEYFKEVSFGQQLLNPLITNWLPTNAATPAGCNYTQMGSLGRTAAVAAGYALASYQNLVYVFPPVAACGWIGLGYIGGNGVWINGRNTTTAYGHELGHNLGLLHAASLRCGSLSIGGACSVSEYGDPFDIMGNQSVMHFNAAQKLDLGWIAAGSVVTHGSGTSTYVLNPIESVGGTTYAVKIPAFANRTYWLEYRQPIGFDAALSNYPNNGAQVRVTSPFETLCGGCDSWSDDTELLDMTPGTSTFTDAALVVGQTFTDSTYGINVNVTSANSGSLVLRVTTPGGIAPTNISIASSLNPALAGGSITVTATVSGVNPSGSVAFLDGGVSITGCASIALSGIGNNRTANCITSGLAAGSHSISAAYGGDSGNGSSTSNLLVQAVNPSPIATPFDHFYGTILGRSPDASGLAFWQSEGTRIQALGVDVQEAYMVMAGVFFGSPEYIALATSDVRYVTDLYGAFLNRAPDAGRLAYWTGQLAAGLPRTVAMYSFMFSPEAVTYLKGLVGSSPSRAEVYAVVDYYRGFLNRLPDSTGFTFWLGQFRTAQCAATGASGAVYAAADSISSQFVGSAEYLRRNRSNAEFVADLYYAFLRRGGDLAGVNFWINRLDTAAESREQLRRDFLSSPEFSGRVNAVIAQGCFG